MASPGLDEIATEWRRTGDRRERAAWRPVDSPRMDRLRIGLIGWGTVGSAVGELITDGPLPLTLASVSVRNRARDDLPEGIPIVTPDEALDADVVVELAGGVDGPRAWARATLDRGPPYVTANKALLATHGAELAEIADRRSAAAARDRVSVGGGTPMIETAEHLAATGEITRLRGLLNATTTYILSAMGQGQQLRRGARRGPGSRLRRGGSHLRRRRPRRGPEARHPRVGGVGPLASGDATSRPRASSGGRVEAGDVVRLVADGTPDELTVRPKILDQLDPLARDRGRRELAGDRDAGRLHVPRLRPGGRRPRDGRRRLRRPGASRGRRAPDPLRTALMDPIIG